jgi:hypothetical protein
MRFLFIAFLCLNFTFVKSQDIIHLKNPSFEDIPRASRPPKFWKDCGFPNESAPDTQPSGEFSVSRPAIHGNTYLGLVVRDNDTWEAVGQKLERPLKKGKVYQFSIKICRSDLYISLSRRNNQQVNYITPATLRIIGSDSYEQKKAEILWTSPKIDAQEWQEYTCILQPTQDHEYLILEAYYDPITEYTYNGNILLDDCSPLVVKDSLSQSQIDSLIKTKPKTIPNPVMRPITKTDYEASSREARQNRRAREIQNYRKRISNKESLTALPETFDSIITLKNPSFEERNRFNKMPTDWRNCSFRLKGANQPLLKPERGNQLITLEAKENGEKEGLFQEINYLKAGQRYSFSIRLAYDPNYQDKSPHSDQMKAFSEPLTLQIWGGYDSCEEDLLLFETPPIDHDHWREYEVYFTPKESINFIGLTPNWHGNNSNHYNGHLVIDYCSKIQMVK